MGDRFNKSDDPSFGVELSNPAKPKEYPFHVVGEAQQYTSVYGYQKFRYPVFKCDEQGNHSGSPIGFIKEEVVVGKGSRNMGRTYYERNGWKKKGQLRFYASPEALLEACLMPVLPGFVSPPPPPPPMAISSVQAAAAAVPDADDGDDN